MPNHWTGRLVWLAVGIVVLQTATGSAAPPLSHMADDKSAEGHLVGIMGAVARPGTYPLSAKSARVADHIRDAGGFTDQFSGSVRVVRRLDDGYRASYVTDPGFPLEPGDVVIADTAVASEAVPETESSVTQNQYVQLSFLNLIDRPIVLKLPKGDADISGILSRLRQPSDAAKTLQVFTPPGRDATSIEPRVPLASGSVVVFDRSVLETEKIPPPPPPIVPGRSTAEKAHSSEAIEASQAGGVQLTAIPAESGTPPSDEPTAGPLFPEAHESGNKRPIQQRAPLPGVSLSTLESNPPRSSDSEAAGQAAEARIPASGSGGLPEANATSSGNLEPAGARAEETSAETTSPLTVATVVVCFVLFATLTGVLYANRRRRFAKTAESLEFEANRENRSPRERLDEIINDQLPIAVEPPQLPRVVEFSGRTGRGPSMRIDAAHTGLSPHFDAPFHEPKPREPAASPPPAGSRQAESSGESGTQHTIHPPHVQARTPALSGVRTERAGVLDRALSNLQGDTPE